MYLQIAVNVAQVSGLFDYHVPEHLRAGVKPGCLVEIPFGRQTVQGIVLQEVEFPQVPETRAILSLLDPEPVITPLQMRLAHALAEDTFSPLSVCLGAMLPPGLRQQADTLFRLSEQGENIAQEDLEGLNATQKRLIELFKKPSNQGGLRGRQLAASLRHQDWRTAARILEKKGWLTSHAILPPPSVRPKKVKTVQLACPPEEALQIIGDLGRGAAGERRQVILQLLLREPWPIDLSWVYAASGGNLNDLRKLEEKGLLTFIESEIMRDPLQGLSWDAASIPHLTGAQNQSWHQIEAAFRTGAGFQPFLLHGVTSSGKTELYLRAVTETLRQGRQAIVLVPEISLTPQTVRRFQARFPGQVGLIHSRLSEGERYDTWRRARSAQLRVIIGPRSALFAPLPDPGLIVVDECHDDSYYQNENQPFYHAVQAALRLAKLAEIPVILGSATPPVDLLYRAMQNKWQVLSLPQRILAHRESVRLQMERLGREAPAASAEGESRALPLPPVQVVDMRSELKAGNISIFSRALNSALAETLANRQQAILFLNRRGRATYVFCRDCGHSLRCPRCDLPLTYHLLSSQNGLLLCHTCNYRRGMPVRCPQCNSSRIRQFGTGTEKVESELQALFPQARILRWDASTTRGKNAHEILLSQFVNQQADILVGTQMLAKGLDLPLVTLVGVILAEVGLNFPDFRAGERTFQLLTQVAGRAGRSPLGGRVILQTFQPNHYAIQAASRHDYKGFYNTELGYRRQIGYPPFSRLLRLEYRHQQAERAEQTALSLASQIQQWLADGDFRSTEMIGPVPCYFGKLRGYYRWQIILRGPDPLQVVQGKPLGEWRVEVDPQNLL